MPLSFHLNLIILDISLLNSSPHTIWIVLLRLHLRHPLGQSSLPDSLCLQYQWRSSGNSKGLLLFHVSAKSCLVQIIRRVKCHLCHCLKGGMVTSQLHNMNAQHSSKPHPRWQVKVLDWKTYSRSCWNIITKVFNELKHLRLIWNKSGLLLQFCLSRTKCPNSFLQVKRVQRNVLWSSLICL